MQDVQWTSAMRGPKQGIRDEVPNKKGAMHRANLWTQFANLARQ